MVAPEDPRFHPTDRWHRETAVPDWGARLRRRLDYPPPVGEPSGDLAAWLASWIAEFELIEPPGRLAAPPDAAGISWRVVPMERI